MLKKRFARLLPARLPRTAKMLRKRCEVCGIEIPFLRKGNKNCDDCYEALIVLSGRDMNREKIRIRDKRTCQECGRKHDPGERRFDVHHLDGLCGKMSRSYDTMENTDRLTTLCHSCHMSKHVKTEQRTNRLTKVQIAKFQQLREDGLSYRGIALQLGVSYASIYNRANGKGHYKKLSTPTVDSR